MTEIKSRLKPPRSVPHSSSTTYTVARLDPCVFYGYVYSPPSSTHTIPASLSAVSPPPIFCDTGGHLTALPLSRSARVDNSRSKILTFFLLSCRATTRFCDTQSRDPSNHRDSVNQRENRLPLQGDCEDVAKHSNRREASSHDGDEKPTEGGLD